MKDLNTIKVSEEILFSIIIPSYNRGTFIVKTVNSVLAQTYTNFEVIVVDDGSTDNTAEVINEISDSRLVYHRKNNAERGAARNAGAQLAKGEYVNFFDSDDLLYPNHLHEAYQLIEEKKLPEFFHLGYDVKTPSNELIQCVDNFRGDIGSQLINGNILSCNGVFIRSDIALMVPFNEERSLSALEDWELWLRMVSRFNIHYKNVVTSTVINHDQRSVLVTQKEALLTRQKVLVESLKKDNMFIQKFGKKLNILRSSLNTYSSLHLALTKKYRILALIYLCKGILQNPRQVFSRRFLAIIKHII